MNQRLIHDNEKSFYILALITSIIGYIALIASLFGILYIVVMVLISVIIHGFSMGHIRNNGVKLSKKQFPDIYQRVEELAHSMEIEKSPDIYIIQNERMLNAFATKFFGRNFIILYSDIFELAQGNEDELTFVIAHELAHIKRRHLTKHVLILPGMWVPFLGSAYSRSCEYTCDLIAASYTKNIGAAINALSVLAVGKDLFHQVNIDEYIEDHQKEKGFFLWLTHVTASHPPLPKRIEALKQLQTFPQMYGHDPEDFQLQKDIIEEYLF